MQSEPKEQERITATQAALAFTYAALERRTDNMPAADSDALTDAIRLIDEVTARLKRVKIVWMRHVRNSRGRDTLYELENILEDIFGTTGEVN